MSSCSTPGHALQGFPDYFALVGVEGQATLKRQRFRSWVRHTSLTARFQQVSTMQHLYEGGSPSEI